MKLQTLKTTLAKLNGNRFKTLEAKAGTTERIRGRAWMETRQKIALAHGYRCVDCGLIWRSHIDQIDHTVPLERGGSNDESNLNPLCNECHKVKTLSERGERRLFIKDLVMPFDIYPSLPPLTIVCGPAAGGKSTYIRDNMAKGDYLIDMDNIRLRLGIKDSEWGVQSLQSSLLMRNNMLRSLKTLEVNHAWFIVSASKCKDRDWWMNKLKPKQLIVVTAGLSTCLSRIDETRTGHRAERSRDASAKWWNEFTNESCHNVLHTG
jgi:hypothetical protein